MNEEDLKKLSIEELNREFNLRRLSNIESAQFAKTKTTCSICNENFSLSALPKHKRDCEKIQIRRNQIKSLLLENLKVREIALSMGINPDIIRHDLRKMNIETPESIEKNKKIETVSKLLEQGKSIREIGRITGIGGSGIGKFMKTHNLKKKPIK